MDKQITVIAKQSLPDIAVQGGGSLDTIFDLAAGNSNINITSILSPAEVLSIPTISDSDVATYFDSNQLRPVSEYTDEEYDAFSSEMFQEGIGYWHINQDFVVHDAELDE